MAIIKDSDRAAIQKQLEGLPRPVKLINFTQELECQYCSETGQLVRALSELSDQLSFEQFNFITDKEASKKYDIRQIPATVVMADKDVGIRYYGIPSGYEFATLLDTIKMTSRGESGLSPKTREFLGGLTEPVNLKVFITPT